MEVARARYLTGSAKIVEPEQARSGQHRVNRTVEGVCAVAWKSISDIPAAVRALGCAPAVMTASFEGRRSGLLLTGVALAAIEPACLVVSVSTGHRLATLIRDARTFGVSVLSPNQKLLLKKLRAGPEDELDPFDTLEMRTLVSASPLLCRAVAVFDCEVVRHLDLEADCELYVGRILAAGVSEEFACADSLHSGSAKEAAIAPANGASHGPNNGLTNGSANACDDGSSGASAAPLAGAEHRVNGKGHGPIESLNGKSQCIAAAGLSGGGLGRTNGDRCAQ